MAKLGDQFEAKYGYQSDTSIVGDVRKLMTMNTQAPRNAGVAFEMEALGFGVVVAAGPSVSAAKTDKTDTSALSSLCYGFPSVGLWFRPGILI